MGRLTIFLLLAGCVLGEGHGELDSSLPGVTTPPAQAVPTLPQAPAPFPAANMQPAFLPPHMQNMPVHFQQMPQPIPQLQGQQQQQQQQLPQKLPQQQQQQPQQPTQQMQHPGQQMQQPVQQMQQMQQMQQAAQQMKQVQQSGQQMQQPGQQMQQPGQQMQQANMPGHIQSIQQRQFANMHPLAEMATQGLLPAHPPALVSGQLNPSSNSAPALLPPPLLPTGNKGPSPQFQEMVKKMQKEHHGQLPPGLGVFTAPLPIGGNAAEGKGDAQSGVGTGVSAHDPILPAMALPRDLPQQPKGPSIPQIMQIQKQHQEYLKKQQEKSEPATKKAQANPQGPVSVDPEFRSPLVDSTVDAWIDQEIAKKSNSFKRRLTKVYRKRQQRATQRTGKGGADDLDNDDDIANNYDPDGTVFLSKISNVLSTEHPDMGSRLDKWIDKQVNSAMSRHSRKGKGDDDDGDVWLQDAMEDSEQSEEHEGIQAALSRDFAKGVFYSSAKKNRKEFGSDAPVSARSKHHRKIKRRKDGATDSAQVLLQVSERSTNMLGIRSMHSLFSDPIDHGFNWDPEDNRFRTDKDTNVQDPDYVDFAMHRVIEKQRKHGRNSKQAKDTMDKWMNIATGQNKDPLEGLFPGSRFDFANDVENSASPIGISDGVSEEHNFDMNNVLRALGEESGDEEADSAGDSQSKTSSKQTKKAKKAQSGNEKKRRSDAWGM